MGYSCGIIGLPNVGKSTLFNALTKLSVASSNYPFCTIEANKGRVPVYDEKLQKLAALSKSRSVVPAYMDFTDIAGLVKGASKGVGLGNKFLSHIQDVECIAQVIRLFEDPEIIHIGEIDPIRDIDIILTELRLKDLQTLEKRRIKLEKERKVGKKEVIEEVEWIIFLEEHLNQEKSIQGYPFSINQFQEEWIKEYKLLSGKEMFIIANIEEENIKNPKNNSYYQTLLNYCEKHKLDIIPISAKLESELINVTEEEKKEYLEMFDLKESGLNELIRKGYEKLNLISFFTTGEKESRSWVIQKNISAKKAASKIHSDIERGFISVDVISYDHFIQNNGKMDQIRDKGFLRSQGKDYIVQDSDILSFKFNV